MIAQIKLFFVDLWIKIKNDVTNATTLIATILGSIMAHIDDIAGIVGDPNLNQQIATVLGDAKAIGRWMLTVGIIGAIARFKALLQSPGAQPPSTPPPSPPKA